MSWETVKLGQIIKLEYGKGLNEKDRFFDGAHPAFGANGIKSRTNLYLYDKPSIIVGRKGSAGELTLVREKFWALDVSYYLVHDQSKTDLRYLYFALLTKNLPKFARGVKPGINRNDIYELEIPLPPLFDQQKIVTKLDAIFAKIDKATAAAEANIKNAEALFQSYLSEVFERRSRGTSDYHLGDICKIVGGGTPSKSNQKFYDGDIPWATVRDMGEDIIKATDFKITADAVRQSSTNIIPKNNVVIATRVGLGKVCILANDTAINQDLRGIIPFSNDLVRVEYLFYWFKSISKLIVDAGRGATVQGVTLPFVKNLKIRLPSIKDQQEIIFNIYEIQKNLKFLTNSTNKKINNLNCLKQSILQQAFNGELVKE